MKRYKTKIQVELRQLKILCGNSKVLLILIVITAEVEAKTLFENLSDVITKVKI